MSPKRRPFRWKIPEGQPVRWLLAKPNVLLLSSSALRVAGNVAAVSITFAATVPVVASAAGGA
jgi:hypothetical protein